MRLLALSLLLAGTASAQDTILTPGHSDLDMDALTLSDVSQDVRMIEPQPTSLGLNIETIQLDGDVLTLVSKSDIELEGGVRMDSTRLAWPSLALLSQTIVRASRSGHAMTEGGQLVGAFGAEGEEAPFAFPRTEPIFPAAALPLVIRALPLDRAGYEAEVPVFSPDSRFREVYLTVGESETVTLSDGREVDAVVVAQAGGPRGTQRHFVDPDTREIVRTEVSAQGGIVIHVTAVTDDELAEIQAANAAERAAAEDALEAAAANAIRPGDASLVVVAPQNVTMSVRLVQPQEQDLGTITIGETIADGQLILTSDIQIPAAGQVQQDTTLMAYPSLMPISRVEVRPNEVERSTFTDGQKTTVTTQGEETTTVEAALEDAFGPGVTNHLIRMLPFADGYATSFRQINGEGEISMSALRVTGQTSYTTPSGTERMVWTIVETEEGNPDYTYTVDAETRELLRIEFSPQPGVTVAFVAP
ncbi:MAG: hypothetical protein Rubg2KO_35930 [Rubricoccaceae bacterium]